MKFKNKKARLFALGMAFVMLIALLRVYYLVEARKSELNGEFSVGANQISMFAAIQNSEKAMLFSEQGLSLAFQQSLYDISMKGGYVTSPASCGTYRGYSVWRKDESTECYPSVDLIKKAIAESTLDSLNSNYISKNPYVKTRGTYKNNHEMFLEQKGNFFIARAYALVPVRQDIVCNYGKPKLLDFGGVAVKDAFASEILGACGRYYYKPSLRKQVKFNINDFKTVSDKAKIFKNKFEECEKSGKTASACVNQAIEAMNSQSSIKFEWCEKLPGLARGFIICANTGNNVLVKNPKTGQVGVQDVEIRFAMIFPKEEAPPEQGDSAEIEFEESDWFTMNIHYQFRKGEWEWRCPNFFCGYSTFRSLDDSAVSRMTSQFQGVTNGLKGIRNDYDKGTKLIQDKINEDNDGYLKMHYTSGCTITTSNEYTIDNLADLARNPANPPSGESCD